MPYQRALIQYLVTDDVAWSLPEKAALRVSLPIFERRFSKKKFGMVLIPTKVLMAEISLYDETSFSDFASYHAWYSSGGLPDHSRRNRWPIILSRKTNLDGLLEDGWHRFHCYVRQRARNIPCLYFP